MGTSTQKGRTLRKTTQRQLPGQREKDREKLNRGEKNAGNPKKHDSQTDDRSRGTHQKDDQTNDNYR